MDINAIAISIVKICMKYVLKALTLLVVINLNLFCFPRVIILVIELGRLNRNERLISSVVTNLENTLRSET